MQSLNEVLRAAGEAILNYDLESAIVHMNLATVIDVTEPRHFSKLGVLYFYNKQFQESVDCMQTVLEHIPNDYDSRTIMADSMNKLGRYYDAIDEVNMTLLLVDEDQYARIVLGDSYVGIKRSHDAIVQYKFALCYVPEQDADSVNTRFYKQNIKRAHVGMMNAHRLQGDNDSVRLWHKRYENL